MTLPADPASEACATCHGRCCLDYDVTLDGWDLLRLIGALRVPWQSVARLVPQPPLIPSAFRLDQGKQHWALMLHRQDDGACRLLLRLPGDRLRCGVHPLRPAACRVYPLRATPHEGSSLLAHAICPEPQAALYRLAAPTLRPLLDEDNAQGDLWFHVVQRWDQAARLAPVSQPIPGDRLVAWLSALYAGLPSRRVTPEVVKWIEGFELPQTD